jgi:hypothetical protein
MPEIGREPKFPMLVILILQTLVRHLRTSASVLHTFSKNQISVHNREHVKTRMRVSHPRFERQEASTGSDTTSVFTIVSSETDHSEIWIAGLGVSRGARFFFIAWLSRRLQFFQPVADNGLQLTRNPSFCPEMTSIFDLVRSH